MGFLVPWIDRGPPPDLASEGQARRGGKAKRAHRRPPAWARRCAPLPTLVLARISMVDTFRKERSDPGGHPGRTADRRIVAHPSL